MDPGTRINRRRRRRRASSGAGWGGQRGRRRPASASGRLLRYQTPAGLTLESADSSEIGIRSRSTEGKRTSIPAAYDFGRNPYDRAAQGPGTRINRRGRWPAAARGAPWSAGGAKLTTGRRGAGGAGEGSRQKAATQDLHLVRRDRHARRGPVGQVDHNELAAVVRALGCERHDGEPVPRAEQAAPGDRIG
jgi:hypothetical protein